jgi:hypothetical protein
LADGDIACDRDDAQLLPEFILKRYCRVVLADAHMAHIWGLQSFGHGQSIAEYDMPPRRRLPANAEIAVRAHMEPVLLKGGETVKSLSTAFLADLEEDWRNHGEEIFPILRAKYPQAYFQGIVSLARIIKWDVDPTDVFDRALSPEEIMDKLEERVGPKGRKLFEKFLRKVNKLHAQQYLEAQARVGVTERSRGRGPV